MPRPSLPLKTCIQCHKDMPRRNRYFCSLKCFGLHKTEKPDTLVCEYCKKEFSPKYIGQKCCSVPCANNLKSTGHTIKICPTCGKEFKVVNYFINRRIFCSLECRRRSAKVYITSIERTLYSFLDEIKIEYEKQYTIKNSTPDAYIPSLNLCIFVDGEYWHGLENVKERDTRITSMLENMNYSVFRIISKSNKIDLEPLRAFLINNN